MSRESGDEPSVMNRPPEESPAATDLAAAIEAELVWQHPPAGRGRCVDVAAAVQRALAAPDDFPPLGSAIVPGDRVALAVDPNVPQVDQVLQGVIAALRSTDAASIEVTVWDEAAEETMQRLRDAVGDLAEVIRHDSVARASLRFLGADVAADPVYLNRQLVDADFVLPIMASRALDHSVGSDLTGIFPALADSASRGRDRAQRMTAGASPAPGGPVAQPHEPSACAWQLGVQLLLSVAADSSAKVSQVHAGTRQAISRRMKRDPGLLEEDPRPAPLVIAAVDGDQQQQTWINAARAVQSASRLVSPGGTIVLWTEIDQPLADAGGLDPRLDPAVSFQPTEDEPFPPWDADYESLQSLLRVLEEHRLLIHSRLDREMIESLGAGVIEDLDQLSRLSQSVAGCGLLRAAQFAGSTPIVVPPPSRC